MTLYVLLMSTDEDIVRTKLHPNWGPPKKRCSLDEVKDGGLDIDDKATIVVIAHGNANEIGDAGEESDDDMEEDREESEDSSDEEEKDEEFSADPAEFLGYIRNNMEQNGVPSAIYLSACSEGIPQFIAAVRLLMEKQVGWEKVRLFGHYDEVSGVVPPPTEEMSWPEIFDKKDRLRR